MSVVGSRIWCMVNIYDDRKSINFSLSRGVMANEAMEKERRFPSTSNLAPNRLNFFDLVIFFTAWIKWTPDSMAHSLSLTHTPTQTHACMPACSNVFLFYCINQSNSSQVCFIHANVAHKSQTREADILASTKGNYDLFGTSNDSWRHLISISALVWKGHHEELDVSILHLKKCSVQLKKMCNTLPDSLKGRDPCVFVLRIRNKKLNLNRTFSTYSNWYKLRTCAHIMSSIALVYVARHRKLLEKNNN